MEHHIEYLTVARSLLGLCSSNGNDLERPNRPYLLKLLEEPMTAYCVGDGVRVLNSSTNLSLGTVGMPCPSQPVKCASHCQLKSVSYLNPSPARCPLAYHGCSGRGGGWSSEKEDGREHPGVLEVGQTYLIFLLGLQQ